MKKKHKVKTQLSIQVYIGLTVVIALLLLIILMVTNLDQYTRQKEEALEKQKYSKLKQEEDISIIERQKSEDGFILVANNYKNIEDGLRQAKISHTTEDSLKSIENINKNLILDGENIRDDKDIEILKKFIDQDKKIIFLSLPKTEIIKTYQLDEILGIASISEEVEQKQLTLVPGFILGGLHEFKKMKYTSLKVKPLYSTKIYGYGEEDDPIIWRNRYENSDIYIVNAPFMTTNASYGILSAIMSQTYEDYIYPIVNARLMTYEGFPYLSSENKENLVKLYNRNAMKFQEDILMKDILTINNRREFIPNGYFRLGFKQDLDQDIGKTDNKQINNIYNQIYRAGGDIGLRYSGNAKSDRETFKKTFKDKEIKSVIVDENIENKSDALEVSDKLISVLGPWDEQSSFKYLDKDTIYIPITIDGLDYGDKEKLEFLSAATSFGIITQNLDIEDIVLNDSDKENWTSTSKKYIKFIDDYRQRLDFIASRNIASTSNNIKVFKNNSPKINIEGRKIEIETQQDYIPSYFILRTDKVIGSVKGGKVENIETGSYLVSVSAKNMTINIKKPKNIKARR